MAAANPLEQPGGGVVGVDARDRLEVSDGFRGLLGFQDYAQAVMRVRVLGFLVEDLLEQGRGPFDVGVLAALRGVSLLRLDPWTMPRSATPDSARPP